MKQVLLVSTAIVCLAAAPVQAQETGGLDSLDMLGDSLFGDGPATPPAEAGTAAGTGNQAGGAVISPAMDSLTMDDLTIEDLDMGDVGPPGVGGTGMPVIDSLDFGTPTISADAPPAKQGFVTTLLDNATYEVAARGYLFFRGAGEKRNDAFWGRIGMASEAPLTDNLHLKGDLRAMVARDTINHRGVFGSPNAKDVNARYVDFDTLFLRWEQPSHDVVLGKAELSQGVGTMVSPADIHGNAYGVMPQDAYNIGTWQARFNYYRGDDVASITVVPFDQKNSSPGDKSRWQGPGGMFGFDLEGMGEPELLFRDASPRNWTYLAQYKAVRSGYDWFVSASRGHAGQPVVRRAPLDLEYYFPQVATASAGGTATKGRWKLYGEASYQHSLNRDDQNRLHYMAGISYRETQFANSVGIDEIEPALEYVNEWITREQRSGRRFAFDSSSVRPFREAILGRVDVRIDNDWSTYGGATYNFVDGDRSFAAGGEYKPTDSFKMQLDLMHFGGSEDTQFGRWRSNGNVRLGFVWNL